ncbi:MAG: ParB/RepB/Spo0J family partition protein [Anaerolineales bacterium]|nr:ParB/RepB/Spo0J family partition protein [Anaerolineales bacterium]
MSKRRGLGRGLGALIPNENLQAEPSAQSSVQTVPVGSIQPNPHQPRMMMDEDKLTELADSIKEHGLIQPLIVTKAGEEGYYLIAGERRWRASQKAGLTQVPVVVKEATPQAMLELAIIENIQRADLNPLEEAFAYQQLMDEFGLTQEQVAQRVGKGRSTVANLVRLLGLPEAIQEGVSNGRLSGAHARALLPLPTPDMQTHGMELVIGLALNVRQTETLAKLLPLGLPETVMEAVLLGNISLGHAQALAVLPTPEMQSNVTSQIIARQLTVMETEALVKRLQAKKKPAAKIRTRMPAELVSLRDQFEHALGTRVSIEKSGKGGKIVLHYYSNEELQAIYDAIIGEQE